MNAKARSKTETRMGSHLVVGFPEAAAVFPLAAWMTLALRGFPVGWSGLHFPLAMVIGAAA